MMRIHSSLFLGRLSALALALYGGMGQIASAQTVSNTASVTWDAGSSRVERLSNRVEIAIDRPQPGKPVISTYSLSPGTGGTRVALPPTQCQSSSGVEMIIPDGVYAGTPTNPANLTKTTQIYAGRPLVILVDSADDAIDPERIETMSIMLETPAGDEETIELTETAPNSARFIGMIRTAAVPPTPVHGDCTLSLSPGEQFNLTSMRPKSGQLIASTPLETLIDPFGIIFDSGTGEPVQGARVTLIDDASGNPAQVFGDDGRANFPATVEAGVAVTDSAGTIYQFPTGFYRFPFVRPGRYHLKVEIPAPYVAPSATSPGELAGLRRPDGQPFVIVDGSYARSFTLDQPDPVRIDIPVDRPGAGLSLRKTASKPTAVPGDAVQYRIEIGNNDRDRATGLITIRDQFPDSMRLRTNTVRLNGNKISYSENSADQELSVVVPALAAGKSALLSYILEVRADAQPGNALNRASARDSHGASTPIVDALVRVLRDDIGDRMTLIGQIRGGGCMLDPHKAKGVAHVRVMLEDGSYAITDDQGRYHFEGLLPGLHVVQIDPASLPADQIPADCARNARSGGSAISRFIEGRGGALLRADFTLKPGKNNALASAPLPARAPVATDQEAAATDRNWTEDQAPGIGWLFPAPDHNPRTPVTRVAIKHLPGQTVRLFANGKPVDPLTLDGVSRDATGAVAVSVWRGIELTARDTMLRAEIVDAQGKPIETLTRNVHFAPSPLRAELVRDQSRLVADGVTRPLIALRLFDRDGKPVHHGLVGEFSVPAPYAPAVEADARAATRLSGLERAKPVWHVEGDTGLAYIELEPTTASGGLTITLPFRDGEVARTQRIDAWLTPGNRPWTVVGFAAGTLGFNTLANRIESLGQAGNRWRRDGRLALYAKGRVKGKWLMTMAYDSDKKGSEARFAGTIDPSAYYTVYGDRSERRYDAASLRKLYLRLERPQFYALFGDYETGLNDPQLARYNRAFNGLKAEFRNERVSANAFAADTPFTHRREEIQGNGLSGPYALAVRDLLANSERVAIETRDRFQSNRIVSTRALVRHIDYDIDYLAGTLRFREPVLSRSSALDPQFIIVDYEVSGIAQRVINAGGRASWTSADKKLVIGASAIHDENEQARTDLAGLDLRYTPSPTSEIRAEIGGSTRSEKRGATSVTPGEAAAWLVEAEHHGSKYDLLAYARQYDRGFGVGQTNQGETGTRKFGVDARLRVSSALSLSASGWTEAYLASPAARQAVRALAEYRGGALDLRAGFTFANDRYEDGHRAQSTIGQLGATKRLFGNRLELDAQTEVPLGQSAASIDFPTRHRLAARFAATDTITLVGSYELASGSAVDARTARIGFDVKPWRGARLTASANAQASGEYGARRYAAYGLSQSLPISSRLTIDATLDANKTLSAITPTAVLNPSQPVASGGFVGSDGTLSEDFTALTFGASYRGSDWSFAGRGEYRDGSRSQRHGMTLSALRQIGEGRAFGGAMSWFSARSIDGTATLTRNAALSWAHRPATSALALLDKLEFREDRVRNARAGQAGPLGGAPLTVSGNALSRRLINSLSLNYAPHRREQGEYLGRTEISLFWGARYSFDRFGSDDLKGLSNVIGSDVRFDLGKHVDLGASATLRQNPGGRSYAWAGGPTLGISPVKNSYISLGYNLVGYRDRDFEDSRYTRRGPYVTVRLKFDQTSFQSLGLGRR